MTPNRCRPFLALFLSILAVTWLGGCFQQTTSFSSSSAITLTGCAIRGYWAPVSIGSHTYTVIVDSGSTDLAVASSSCSNCTGLSPTYSGSTGTNQNSSITDVYGSGSWTGELYKDSVTLGTYGLSQGEFAAITSQTSFFNSSDCELGSSGANQVQGIMGVGYMSVSNVPAGGILTQLSSSSLSLNNLAAMQMCETGGKLWFGSYDASYMTSVPEYSPVVTSNGHYAITVTGISLNSTSLIPNGTSSYTMLVDSGTSIGEMPSAVFSNLETALNTAAASSSNSEIQSFGSNFLSGGSCLAPSLTSSQIDAALPTLDFTVTSTSGGSFTLNLPATKSYLDMHLVSGQTYYCSGAGSASSSTYIIGATFLRNFVTVFDRVNSQVGFATQTGCAN